MPTCSVCDVEKSPAMFGVTRIVSGRSITRAQCRACYNTNRRLHYAKPDVRSEKIRKRHFYQSRVGFSEARKLRRRTDSILRAKEKSARDRYRQRPEVKAVMLEWKAQHRAKPSSKADTLYTACKLRAAKRGLPFSLTREWVRERVIAGRCELTGLPFDYGPPPEGWCYNPMLPSVDQRVAGAGYTIENCRVVITSINNALSQYGEAHFAEVAIAYLMRRGYRVDR